MLPAFRTNRLWGYPWGLGTIKGLEGMCPETERIYRVSVRQIEKQNVVHITINLLFTCLISYRKQLNLPNLLSLWKWSCPIHWRCLRRWPCWLAFSPLLVWDILSASIQRECGTHWAKVNFWYTEYVSERWKSIYVHSAFWPEIYKVSVSYIILMQYWCMK